MVQRKIDFVVGEHYHLYNRSNSKQVIFHDRDDYARFMKLLFLSNDSDTFKIQFLRKKEVFDLSNRPKPIVGIGAWVLMPNHFHILATPLVENVISTFMQKLTTGYSMYYNQKYKHTGGLFEGKFKSEYAGEDRYLKYLFSYIHLNPLKLIDQKWKVRKSQNIAQSMVYLKKYQYSSYLDHVDNTRPERLIGDLTFFPPYFTKKNSVEKEMFDWISYRQDL